MTDGPAPIDFDALYRDDADPWRVASSWYEQRKLDLVLSVLANREYASAWDPGCGTGELAARLAARCTRVLATDASEEAVRLTTRRCAGLSPVSVIHLALPAPPPRTGFGLVVLSEFLFYLADAERRDSYAVIDAAAARRAEVLTVHWDQRAHDAWRSGVEVNRELVAAFAARGWRHTIAHRDDGFVLDVLRRD